MGEVVFAIGGLYSRSNGIAWIMRSLAAALGQQGVGVDVYAAAARGRETLGVDFFEPPTRLRTARGWWLGGLSLAPGLAPLLDDAVADARIVHCHSFWMHPTHQAIAAAQRHGRPVVVTAHGALEPYSLRRSRWKKWLVRRLFQDADFAATDCLHVNSLEEGLKVREAGFQQPLAVIPNGTDVLPPADAAPFFARYPELSGRRLMLFMARLHQKKGLGHFLPAWAELADCFPDWHLVVAGPDRGFEQAARELAADRRLRGRVTFTGSLHGEIQRAARAASELFVLPSFSEGFSMAVLEAMAEGLPVLMTPGCNFLAAHDAGAAFLADPTTPAMVTALGTALAAEPDELEQMGQRGRDLVAAEYTWPAVARQTRELYDWLEAGGRPNDRPAFVDPSELHRPTQTSATRPT